ncbi:hypothetical protein Athai_23950 [Actinocatenispora thailandica]|uniref:DUF2784 domain-containing protein n=1 Tax=Actinocatenispora thailandica TaxID=227318 RepID=A0A7R7DP32_9ACTN|nr:DUF2784 domain-containing protein [Actinocatenispora thailandica]BCJ34892.1 hypothetical protein Athai_23950 [Actinocatenispora thailandica]
MGYRWLAWALVAVHFGYLAYLLLGGFVALRWRWTLPVHLAAAGWAVAVVAGHLPCPLTAAQDAARHAAGLPPLTGGFLDSYVRGVFYPRGAGTLAQLVLGSAVLASWALVVLRWRRPWRECWSGRRS